MRDKVKRNFVCVKIIKIKNIPKKEREATKVEVDLLRRLNHPNIVRYIDSFLSKNKESLCICMEYCDGVRTETFAIRYRPTISKLCFFFLRAILLLRLRLLERISFLRAKFSTGSCSWPWVCIICTETKYCIEIWKLKMCSCLAMVDWCLAI